MRLIRFIITAMAVSIVIIQVSVSYSAPSEKETLAAMKKATEFMVNEVSYNGGYVWATADDLSEKWGEVPARPTQIWTQQGTTDAAMALLEAYQVTGDELYLKGAKKAANALIYGQHPLGGWHYVIDFDMPGIRKWYKEEASQYNSGYEEYRHYYGNCTYDDNATTGPTQLLLRLYMTTLDPVYREPLIKALNFILISQYPNGAWPQRYPLRHEFVHDGLADYTSYYTLNDGVAHNIIDVLVEAYEKLGDERYLDAAKSGVDFYIAVQGPEGQAGWAEQYYPDTMQPSWGRTHEPEGYVIRESIFCIQDLEKFFIMTGDCRYLKPIPGCIAWFERLNRESGEMNLPRARYYAPGSNMPWYGRLTGEVNDEEYLLREYNHTPPEGSTTPEYIVDVKPIKREYDRLAAMTSEEAIFEYKAMKEEGHIPEVDPGQVEEIINSLDSSGAWVTDSMVLRRGPNIMKESKRYPVKAVETRTFVGNMRILCNYLKQLQ